jgi:hypothetical protein
MGQAPLIGQFNFGKNSTKESEEMIGCFVGLGRAIGCYPNNQILNGMYFTTGLSFGKEQVISIRFEMTSGRLKPDGKFNNVIGLGLSYHLFK